MAKVMVLHERPKLTDSNFLLRMGEASFIWCPKRFLPGAGGWGALSKPRDTS